MIFDLMMYKFLFQYLIIHFELLLMNMKIQQLIIMEQIIHVNIFLLH